MVGNHAKGHVLNVPLGSFEFKQLDLVKLAEFERENYRIKREKLKALSLPEALYAERLDRLTTRYENGELRLEKDMTFAQSQEGQLLALRLMIDKSEEEAWALFVQHADEVLPLFKLVLRESFPNVKGAIPKPS